VKISRWLLYKKVAGDNLWELPEILGCSFICEVVRGILSSKDGQIQQEREINKFIKSQDGIR
jgi:hypothetical protein